MTKNFTPIDNIEELDYKIYFLRGRRVMLDRDLALLYGVSTKVLNQSVKRNISRFPEDFMFQLTKVEERYITSRYQFGTLNDENGLDKASLKFQFGTSSDEEILRSQSVTSKQNEFLRYHFGTSKDGRGGRRYKTYAFTEQGVAMLSSVLKSERAIQVNIQIMRTFTKIREMLVGNKDLQEKIDKLESKYDSQFTVVFKAIKKLLVEPESSKKSPIGFTTE